MEEHPASLLSLNNMGQVEALVFSDGAFFDKKSHHLN